MFGENSVAMPHFTLQLVSEPPCDFTRDYVVKMSTKDFMKQVAITSDCVSSITLREKPFSGAFTQLRNANISFGMSVCPSAWNNTAPTGWIFMKCDI
jgi:hypothetical protein